MNNFKTDRWEKDRFTFKSRNRQSPAQTVGSMGQVYRASETRTAAVETVGPLPTRGTVEALQQTERGELNEYDTVEEMRDAILGG